MAANSRIRMFSFFSIVYILAVRFVFPEECSMHEKADKNEDARAFELSKKKFLLRCIIITINLSVRSKKIN